MIFFVILWNDSDSHLKFNKMVEKIMQRVCKEKISIFETKMDLSTFPHAFEFLQFSREKVSLSSYLVHDVNSSSKKKQ